VVFSAVELSISKPSPAREGHKSKKKGRRECLRRPLNQDGTSLSRGPRGHITPVNQATRTPVSLADRCVRL
jgi:hypothetical protein